MYEFGWRYYCYNNMCFTPKGKFFISCDYEDS